MLFPMVVRLEAERAAMARAMIAGVNPLPLSEGGDPPVLGSSARRTPAGTSSTGTTSNCWFATSTATRRWTTCSALCSRPRSVNWNAHVATLIDFWAWQLLGEPGYEGQPLRAHEPVHARTPLSHAMYERWIELFCDTVDVSFQGAHAEIAKGRGRKMAAAMERLLSGVSADGAAPVEPMWRRRRECLTTSAISLLTSDIGCRCEPFTRTISIVAGSRGVLSASRS